MAIDREPIVKRSRREGVALHPKAHKIMVKRKSPPGAQGGGRFRGKSSQYALQLREKQKVKRLYGLAEKQFRRLVEEAERKTGITGETLLQFLERRLDNVIYRSHLAPSRQAARQLVTHGHFMLDGQRVDIPSIRVKAGNEITVRPKSANNTYFKSLSDEFKGEKEASYSWFSFDKNKFKIKITGDPKREEADPDISESLIIEFYSR